MKEGVREIAKNYLWMLHKQQRSLLEDL